ncbi:hypothetical protein OXPF_36060 [Oxobacter pfennigii]|uniref:Uncharacterized protein n=1 Tax=Oxobacter pfennigii TaxID=36849 RepID=A0A0P8WKI8_9CLOT|nr:hypothetical protein [Oxobacter pfennigii]KPU42842.1 hypothetical protein OXPF_36060 [Oxobacter pfennigii]
MDQIVSLIVALVVFIIALKIFFKVTGCLIKLVILGVALWFILSVLNYGFNFMAFL